MSQVKIDMVLEVTDADGDTKKTPITNTFTSVNEIYHNEIDVAADATVTLWDYIGWSGFPVDNFDRLILLTNKDLAMEYVTGDTAKAVASDTRATFNTCQLEAGVPYMLGSSFSFGDDTSDTTSAFGTSTNAAIKRIRVKDLDSASGIKLKYWIID